jgi:hypothetical protein
LIDPGKVPVLLPVQIQNMKYQMISWQKSLDLLLRQLNTERSTIFKVVVFNSSGGVKGTEFINFSSAHQVPDDLEVRKLRYALDRLSLTASGLLISDKQPRFISCMITDKPSISSTPGLESPTLFRKGVEIHHYISLDQVDLKKLTKLLELSFQKTLSNEYFDTIQSRLHSIVVAGDYDGALILTKEMSQIYLDKFAVAPSAQGIGVGDILWNVLKTHESVFWRSRADNPVNRW